ncbi:PepSY-associated TM helix domain-containing protein [Piscinibacter sp.]|uniref:PepSY-associated TM helix domain-containing protein n=1 Tax=Piscinibacter sp. TaxID=1903157 RepID=UPI002CC942E6|nr:PepSY-associated TM helix domain-containing protein [Albitalea sp.]HUG22938.1 PepSY-associated TM helix domain-containing protein [Albitalea sp.]
MRKALFQLHRWLGLAAGLVLALVGATGALMSFEPEITRWIDAGVLTVAPRDGRLAAPQLLARLNDDHPQRRVTGLTMWRDPKSAARVVFAVPDDRRGEVVYVDPHGAALRGASPVEGFLHVVEDLHRRLAAGPAGRSVTGAATLCLILMCVTGLVLRWPRRAADWRAWLRLDMRLKGRGFLWQLHAVAGTWVLLLALLTALTGLYFAYDWYRAGVHALTGTPLAKRSAPTERRDETPAVSRFELEPAWTRLQAAVPQWRQVTLRFPERGDQPLQATVLDADAPHDRAFDRLQIDLSGELRRHERHADKPAGARLVAGMLALHTGSFFGVPGRLLMFATALSMPLFAITGWMLYVGRRRRRAPRPSLEADARAPFAH